MPLTRLLLPPSLFEPARNTMPRLSKSILRWIAFAVLTVLGGIVNIQATRVAGASQPRSETVNTENAPSATKSVAVDEKSHSEYDHLLYFVTRRVDGRFVDDLILQSVPGKEEQTLEMPRRVVLTQAGLRPRLASTSVLGVYGGHLLMIRLGRLEAIDLETGERRELGETAWETIPGEDQRRDLERRSPPSIRQGILHGERAFLITGGRQPTDLIEIDLNTLKRRRLHREPADQQLVPDADRSRLTFPLGTIYPRLAIALGGARLAVTAVPDGQDTQQIKRKSTVTVVQRGQDEPIAQRIPHEFRTRVELGGGGDHLHTPLIGWRDDVTLLIVSLAKETGGADAEGSFQLPVRAPYVLHAWNVNTGQLTEVGPIPSADDHRALEPRFWRRPAGELLLHLPKSGDYRIDLEQKEFSRTTQLTNEYALRGHPIAPELWFEQSLIGAMSPHCRVSISPDGKQAAWLPWRIENRGPTFRLGPVPLMHHSAGQGTRELITAQFDAPNVAGFESEPPVSAFSTAPVLWVRADQLARSPRFLP